MWLLQELQLLYSFPTSRPSHLFSLILRSMFLTSCLHTARFGISSPDSHFSVPFTLSIHLCFGLPFLLFPSTSILIIFVTTYSSSLLMTCPYHFNLLWNPDFLGYFSHFCCPPFIPYSVHLFNTTHPSQHRHFCHVSNFFCRAFFAANVSAIFALLNMYIASVNLFHADFLSFPAVHKYTAIDIGFCITHHA